MKKVLTIFLVFSSMLFLGCKKETTPVEAPQPEIFSLDSKQATTQVKNNYTRAQTAAKSWKENAQFTALVLKIYPEMKKNTLTQTFVFASNDDPDHWWTFSIAEKNNQVVRSLTYKEDYLEPDFKPIKEEYLKISYVDALNAAEKAGGTAFRAKNPNAQINLFLAQKNPKGWLWWQAEYISDTTVLKIFINAADGKIYDESGKPIT